jgi:hypothetical protein
MDQVEIDAVAVGIKARALVGVGLVDDRLHHRHGGEHRRMAQVAQERQVVREVDPRRIVELQAAVTGRARRRQSGPIRIRNTEIQCTARRHAHV